MGMHAKKKRKLMVFCLSIICLAVLILANGVAYAAEQTPVEVKLNVESIFVKTGTDADIDEEFDYILTPNNAGDPLPSGASAGQV